MTTERDDWKFPWAKGWPEIDRAGMVEVDRRMVKTYGIALEKMMENAGRALATVAWRRWLVAARRLAAWGACVEIVLARPATALAPVPAGQLAILVGMGIAVVEEPPVGADLILDGLIGYSLSSAPMGRVADLITWANGSATPIQALDVPSGFDASTGRLAMPSVSANATVTLALPKRGLTDPAVRWAVGDLYLADISVPPTLYSGMACPIVTPGFAGEDILRIA